MTPRPSPASLREFSWDACARAFPESSTRTRTTTPQKDRRNGEAAMACLQSLRPDDETQSLRSTSDRAHPAFGLLEVRAVDQVPGLLAPHGGLEQRDDRLVARAAPHRAAEVVLLECEQAGTDLSVGGEADPIAVPAKGARDRRDHPDRAMAVQVAIHRRRGAGIRVPRGFERKARGDR